MNDFSSMTQTQIVQNSSHSLVNIIYELVVSYLPLVVSKIVTRHVIIIAITMLLDEEHNTRMFEASCVSYQLRKSWSTKYKERDACDGHICCSESTELRLRICRSLSRVHLRGVEEQLQTRRVGDTRPSIRHNMIVPLVKR